MANKKTNVLMVCLGNICRSPLAEGLLKAKIDTDNVFVDSAGTSDYHVGDSPDTRSVAVASRHQLDISEQLGRQFQQEDFDRFDRIYVMDHFNQQDVLKLARNEQDRQKVDMILNSLFPNENVDVPDPYQGGEQGFINVYQMLDEATAIIAKELS